MNSNTVALFAILLFLVIVTIDLVSQLAMQIRRRRMRQLRRRWNDTDLSQYFHICPYPDSRPAVEIDQSAEANREHDDERSEDRIRSP